MQRLGRVVTAVCGWSMTTQRQDNVKTTQLSWTTQRRDRWCWASTTQHRAAHRRLTAGGHTGRHTDGTTLVDDVMDTTWPLQGSRMPHA
eukprot:366302-Chlamydomonas_euryale.AAC.3